MTPKETPERFHSFLHPFLMTRTDPSRGGRGIVAKDHIAKDTLVAILGGHVMRLEDEPVFPGGIGDLAVQIHDAFVLGAKYPDEIESVDAFNHSCEPNAGFKGQIFLVAMRDIEAGESVCFDYAMVLNNSPYRMTCLCGSSYCRRIITGEDWKSPELQDRYCGYFSWYLQDKIDSLRLGRT